ncbi:MAG TPA: hypothetical protein ENJ01_08245 [Gammaproteobacteria bacterium]|nr:hypothetical protein [Gammaproteobacteria bacterium]
MKTRNPGLLACCLAGVPLLMNVTPVWALETTYQLGYRLTYQSNIRKTEINPESEWINSFLASVQATETSASIDLNLDASLQRLVYKNNTYPDRSVANATGDLLWTIRPERFTWSVNDYLRETIIDPRDTNVPTNRQRTNTFTTGPDFIFRVTSRDTLMLSYRFIDNYQEVTNIDSQQNLGTLSWQHMLSPVSSLSLISNYLDVDYEAEIYPDRVIIDNLLRYKLARPSIEYQVDIGTTTVRTQNQTEIDGDLRILAVNYNITATETFSVKLSDRLVEAGNIVDAALVPDDQLADGRFLTANVYREKRSQLGYAWAGPFATLTLNVYTSTRNYFQDSTLDNTIDGGLLALGYSATETLQLTLNANISTRRYPVDGRRLDTQTYSIDAVYLISSDLVLTGSVGTRSRDSSVAGQNYDDFIASIGITYTI